MPSICYIDRVVWSGRTRHSASDQWVGGSNPRWSIFIFYLSGLLYSVTIWAEMRGEGVNINHFIHIDPVTTVTEMGPERRQRTSRHVVVFLDTLNDSTRLSHCYLIQGSREGLFIHINVNRPAVVCLWLWGQYQGSRKYLSLSLDLSQSHRSLHAVDLSPKLRSTGKYFRGPQPRGLGKGVNSNAIYSNWCSMAYTGCGGVSGLKSSCDWQWH